MNGKTLGHYKVGEQLGRGGMGEVYVADDLNLNRKVALKFLPDAFTGDPERMARFEREAKLLASLNHPNIAAIYGLEQAEGKRFIVMELVEGETLAQRISKGALPIDEALGTCSQIAEGLEAAHEKGVIHRDLKPANVMITEGDKVKILDFGLAKALSGETQPGEASQSPTLTEAMTRPGIILGTAAYMSPEQAKGKAVDKRADIWAFACILFECLTGKRAFEGETVTEMLAAILRGEPNWNALPPATPPNISFVLHRCLEKDPSLRFRDAADLRIMIEEPASAAAASEAVRRKTSRVLPAAMVVLGMALGLGLAYLWYGSRDHAAQPTITQISAPAEAISAFNYGFALSRDGQTLAFSARTADGRRQIWKRRLDDPDSQPIAGTDDGYHPFWSPDGRHIAFFVPGELRRVPAEGGQVRTICTETGVFTYGTWGDNDQILYSASRGNRSLLIHVSADGGKPVEVPGFGKAYALSPQWLPGRSFLYWDGNLNQICAGSIDGSLPPRQVAQLDVGFGNAGAGFCFSTAGYLFFNRGGALSVQRFDSKSLAAVGQPVTIMGMAGSPHNWFTLAAAQDRAAMLARKLTGDAGNPGDPLARLKWLDRKGEIIGDLGPQGRYWTVRLSPDGLRAAVNPDSDIWVYDSKNRTRVTSRATNEFSAVWSPDGASIAYVCEPQSIMVKPAAQGGQETELLRMTAYWLNPTDWSRDGRYLLLTGRPTQQSTSEDILVYDFKEKSVQPWLATKYDESQARFSPDGSWIAYSSNANGPRQVCLLPFKNKGSAGLVLPGGGQYPVWRRDGRELFYLSPNDELMAVDMANLAAKREVGEPRRLFKVATNDIAEDLSPFDAAPDGTRFLVNVPDKPEPLLFINGIEELLRKREQ